VVEANYYESSKIKGFDYGFFVHITRKNIMPPNKAYWVNDAQLSKNDKNARADIKKNARGIKMKKLINVFIPKSLLYDCPYKLTNEFG